MVATAPAAWAFRILAENEQAPRDRTAILPVSEPAAGAVHASPSPPMEPVTTPIGAVRSDSTVAKSPDARPVDTEPEVNGAPTKCPTVAAPPASARCADP